MAEKSIRQQLIEARANIQREIDILHTPAVIGGPPFVPNPKKALVEKLKAELREIDEALADLGPNDT